KRPRFDLRKGAFSAVTLQVAASNYPLQFFAMPSLPSFELLLKLPQKKTLLFCLTGREAFFLFQRLAVTLPGCL
ncbi:MAG: hypothetical protein IKC65_08445, partial [Lentisphaeria bacterium]|nr:hypothetical protein [Lentisphaeria bacterium]